jgi:hypothetical protein
MTRTLTMHVQDALANPATPFDRAAVALAVAWAAVCAVTINDPLLGDLTFVGHWSDGYGIGWALVFIATAMGAAVSIILAPARYAVGALLIGVLAVVEAKLCLHATAPNMFPLVATVGGPLAVLGLAAATSMFCFVEIRKVVLHHMVAATLAALIVTSVITR